VVNQWGRDGNFSSGSSRSGGGILIAAIVALIVGVGGGYAGARFLSGVSSADIAARDKTIADLNQALKRTKTDVQGASTQQTVLQGRVKDLEAQVTSLQHTRDSLRKYIDQQGSAANADAQAEIAALRKTVDEAGDVSGKLNRVQKSLKVSELQIIELEKTVSDQKAEIGRLQASIEQQADKASPALVLLQGQKTMLETQLAKAKSAAADVPDLKSRIAALEEQLTKGADEADAAAKQQIAALQKQKDALQTRLAAALKSAGDADAQVKTIAELQKQRDALRSKLDAALQSAGNAGQQTKKIADLQKQLDKMAESLADRDEAVRHATDSLKQAEVNLDKAQREVKTLTAQNDVLGDAKADLTRQVASLNAAIAKLKAAAAPADNKPVVTDDSQDDNGQNGLTPRNHGDVEKAVADLPGYDTLSADKQETLVGMLEKGECVTDSLKAAYGHVSPISLSRLFRDLGGHC
jgi:chromosome segregation ATPase